LGVGVRLELEDVLGSRTLDEADLTLGQILAAHRLPETLFQPYLVVDGTTTPISLATRLTDLPARTDRVILRAIRNTLFPAILPPSSKHDTFPRAPVPPKPGVGFRQVQPTDDGAVEAHVNLVPTHARDLVREQVSEFFRSYGSPDQGCVFGVSGGGDSNALAYGLRATLDASQLVAFTLVFEPVFSVAAASRATVLCGELGIAHQVLQPDDVASKLGMTSSLDELYADFSDAFTNEALHFFGTFLILRTARRLADEHGFNQLAFGYNREDLLAELLFMLMNGYRPLSYPVRTLGRHRILMPVWQCPKLLLDACHPRFSLDNYRERDPFTTRQRSLAFFLAHTMDSSYPSFGLSLLQGASTALDGCWGDLVHDDEMDLFIAQQAEPASIDKVRDLLARHFAS
jgi:hypothetical protein